MKISKEFIQFCFLILTKMLLILHEQVPPNSLTYSLQLDLLVLQVWNQADNPVNRRLRAYETRTEQPAIYEKVLV